MSRGRQAQPAPPPPGRQPPQNGNPQGRRSSSGVPIAALASIVGLLVIVLGSVFVMSTFAFQAPSDQGPQVILASGQTEPPITDRTLPTVNPVIVTAPPDQRPNISGTLLFSRSGNIWAAQGLNLTPISTHGTDSAPAWAPDGKSFYVIETIRKDDIQPPFGGSKFYFFVTNIAQMNADGSNRQDIFKSMFSQGGGQWYTGVYQPDVSPDGKTFALVSDFGYVPPATCISCYQPVVLGTMTTRGTNLTNLKVKSSFALGHNDPMWSPDGKTIAFTYNDKSGSDGTPRIGLLTYSNHNLALGRKGYADPSWSPDGKMIAAERVTTTGRDIVILNPNTGTELARLTNDNSSFAPVWSPDGNQIAFLHRHNLGIDLEIMTLNINAGGITLVDTKPVTQDGSIDPSPPAWFIPKDERTALPTPPAANFVGPSEAPSEAP